MSTPPDTFLSLHTAVILLAAVAIGMVVGWLILTGAPVAAAPIARVFSAGGSLPALRTLIG